jgi:hypothetical protein
MPAALVEDPLSVEFTFSRAAPATVDLEGLPNPQLAHDLARGMSLCGHPHGGVDNRASASRYGSAVRLIVRRLSETGFEGGASELRRHQLASLWLASSYEMELCGRQMLRAFDAATGALHDDVRVFVEGRNINVHPSSKPYEPYSDTEWTRLIDRCEEIVGDARRRQRAALRAAESAASPDLKQITFHEGVSDQVMAWLMVRHGPFGRGFVRDLLGWDDQHLDHGTAETLGRTREALFPTTDITFAYRVLLGAYSGIVADGIASLGLDDIEWAGDSDVLLSYVKGRTGPESVHLPKRAVRLLERWLEYSAVLRRFAPPALRPRLWIVARGAGRYGGPPIGPLSRRTGLTSKWCARNDVTADDGSVLPLHRSRIRTTYVSMLARRSWTGRTTIDPNHTARVEGDHYASSRTPAQEESINAIIEDAQADLLRKARPPAVLAEEQTTELVRDYPQVVADLNLDDAAIRELVGGERDVFTAACADQLAGQYGPAGQPCPARPWVCLMCPLAVFLPRHAPNLLRLKAFFARQFRQMPTDQFLRVFGPYADRLDTQILPRFSEQTITGASRHVADDDSELPLRPEEMT